MKPKKEKSILDKFLYVTMPDGSVWSIPVRVIAENRAEYYKNEYDNDLEKSLKEDTVPLFSLSYAEIQDWAENNMDWEDVEKDATLSKKASPEVDYQEGWVNGEKEIV